MFMADALWVVAMVHSMNRERKIRRMNDDTISRRMTNTEAIETLRANYPDACFEQLREAVDKAIVALKVQNTSGDTIRRQAANTKMKKYRKKPIVIEAYQTDVELDIETLEGIMHASVGDYIIIGVNGEKYPCKPDIFKKTYEEISDEQ